MERITGSIDRIMPQSCYARIAGQDGEYYSFWHDGSCGSVSKNQEYLIAYLDNHTGDIEEWPLVVFTPKSGEVENIAFDVEWVKEPDLKFALPVSPTNGIPLRSEGKQLWFVYDQPLDPHLVTEGDLYWFQIHRGKEKRGKFIVKSSVNNVEHLVGRKDVQTALLDGLKSQEVRSRIETMLGSEWKDQHPARSWNEIEKQWLRRLPPTLSEFIRETLIKNSSHDQLSDAWNLTVNRKLIQSYYPTEAASFSQNDIQGIIEALIEQLGGIAIDCEVDVRTNEVREIGAFLPGRENSLYTAGNLRDFQVALDNPKNATLIGHNLEFDLQYLTKISRKAQSKPILDTLVIDSILAPRSRSSLRLGSEKRAGAHHADADAKEAYERLCSQIKKLSELPSPILESWKAVSGAGLASLLGVILQYKDFFSELKLDKNIGIPNARSVGVDWLEKLSKDLDGQKALIVCPKFLLPDVCRLPNSCVLDPNGLYLTLPEPNRVEQYLEGSPDHADHVKDLLTIVTAYVQDAESTHRSTHLEGLADWARSAIEGEPGLSPILGVSLENLGSNKSSLNQVHWIVPYSALSDDQLVRELVSEGFERIIFLTGLPPATECSDVVPFHRQDLLDKGLAIGMQGKVIELDRESLQHSQIQVSEGWRAWASYSPTQGWIINRCLEDPGRYLSDLIKSARIETFRGSGTSARTFCLSRWKFPENVMAISASSPYRAEYLAQIGAAVIPLARSQRVLLLLCNAHEVQALERALVGHDIYLPKGTFLARMERLELSKKGLLICSIDQLPRLVSSVYHNQMTNPIDRVCIDAWPTENPAWFQPPTLAEYHALRQVEQTRFDAGAEISNDISENDDNDEDGAFIENEQRHLLTLDQLTARKLTEGIETVYWLLDIAKVLSGTPLCVFDRRFTEDMLDEIEEHIDDKKQDLEVDAQIFSDLLASLQDQGLRGRIQEVDSILQEERWQSYAKTLFGLPAIRDNQLHYIKQIFPAETGLFFVEAPTGSGKSFIFQFPTILKGASTGRLSIVVSPLKALIHEQCLKMWQLGFIFDVESLSGDMTEDEMNNVYRRLGNGEIHLLFISPERFRTRRFRQAIAERIRRDGRIEYWVFDEAHCISLWGYDFRPDFLHAAEQVRQNQQATGGPIILLSATLPAQLQNELEGFFNGKPAL